MLSARPCDDLWAENVRCLMAAVTQAMQQLGMDGGRFAVALFRGVDDAGDGCRLIADPDQGDLDGDGAGDACDEDDDDDGVADRADNCATTANGPQADTDGDGAGDACDKDANGDGFVDGTGISGGGCQTSRGGGDALALLLVLGALLARRRRVGALALVGAAATAAPAAHADERGFAVERFRLSGDGAGVLDVETATTLAPGRWELAMWMGGADDPLVVYDAASGDRLGRLVDLRIGGALGGAVGLTRSLELAATVPVILFQDRAGMSTATLDGTLSGITASGLGDARVADAKLRNLARQVVKSGRRRGGSGSRGRAPASGWSQAV